MTSGEEPARYSLQSSSSSESSSPELPTSPDQTSEGSAHKKQKRRHTVSACESCHNNHLKCDGQQPCHQCVKKKTDCKYTTPGKRGPKPGASSILKSKLAQQEYSIQILTEELARTKHEKEEWKQKYLAISGTLSDLSAPVGLLLHKDQPLSPPPTTTTTTQTSETTSVISPISASIQTMLSKYLEYFKIYVQPLFPLPSLFEKPDPLLFLHSSEPENSIYSLQLSVVLAHGARMSGSPFHSEEFINNARQKARDFFDQTSYEIATSFLLMSYYYIGSGDKNKTSYFHALAFKNCESLGFLETTPIGRRCISLLATSEDLFQDRPELLTKSRELRPEPSELIWQTYMQVNIELRLDKVSDSMSLLRKLEETETTISKTDTLSEFELLNVHALIWGYRAGIFWNERLKDFALDWADKSLKLFNEERFHMCSPTVISSVEIVAQVHLAHRKASQFQNDMWVLERLSILYPLAETVIRKFKHFVKIATELASNPTFKIERSEPPSPPISIPPLSALTAQSHQQRVFTLQEIQRVVSKIASPEYHEAGDIQLVFGSDIDLLVLFEQVGTVDGPAVPWFINLKP